MLQDPKILSSGQGNIGATGLLTRKREAAQHSFRQASVRTAKGLAQRVVLCHKNVRFASASTATDLMARSMSSIAEPNPSLFSGKMQDLTGLDPSEQLRTDVRVMGSLLGKIITLKCGPEIFDKVEVMRAMFRAACMAPKHNGQIWHPHGWIMNDACPCNSSKQLWFAHSCDSDGAPGGVLLAVLLLVIDGSIVAEIMLSSRRLSSSGSTPILCRSMCLCVRQCCAADVCSTKATYNFYDDLIII